MQTQSDHILVIDDDKRIAALICRYLQERGYTTLRAENAAEASVLLESFVFDAMIVDVMMPGQSGIEFLEERQRNKTLVTPPAIMLTALGELGDKMKGFEAGADDYLVKPFEPQELLMRLQVILKRNRKEESGKGRFRIGTLVFDEARQLLDSPEGEIRLTTMEVNLLSALAARQGETLSREELAELCAVDTGERTVDVQVTRLRRKIEEDSKAPKYLLTVRGKGYVLLAERI
ncbi:MAG: response regulator transcription factor [Alphaproteobacteria bacterium]